MTFTYKTTPEKREQIRRYLSLGSPAIGSGVARDLLADLTTALAERRELMARVAELEEQQRATGASPEMNVVRCTACGTWLLDPPVLRAELTTARDYSVPNTTSQDASAE